MLHDLAGIKAGSPPAEVGATLQKSVELLFPENTPEIYPYLARLLDLPLDKVLAERFKRLEAGVLQRQIIRSFCEYVRAHARIQPLVLAWEDLCCTDSSSLDMLEALLPLAGEVPLLLLLVFRSGDNRVDDLRQRLVRHGGNHYHEIQLTPLPPGECVWLLDDLLGGRELPEETRQQILARSEGNPFFLEEMLRSWLDAGQVMKQEDKAGLGAIPVNEIDLAIS
jgi:predicted ATPase